MKLQSELDEVKLQLSNAHNDVRQQEKVLNDKFKSTNNSNKELDELKSENLALRNDISLLKNKINNHSETSQKELEDINNILTIKKKNLSEKEQD
jgi:predicted unusual protein kinase regulating ubiquinone biosynthesis (AarF/ABC1/UbiB family)